MDDKTQIARPRAAAQASSLLPPPSPAAFVLLYAPGETRRLTGHRYRIQHTEAAIGRDPGNDVDLSSDTVSGHHARVSPGSGAWHLRDLNSTNGTWVNQTLVHEQTLRHGDTIRCGRALLRFLCGPSTEQAYRETVQALATTEPRTQLANATRFSSLLTVEAERHRVRGSMLSLVLFSIDDFPSFLAAQGDLAGDDALGHVGRVLQQSTTPAAWELLALLDDQVFALMLPELDGSFAQERAQAAVAALRTLPFTGSTDVTGRFTLSAGVATADLQMDALDLRAAAHVALVEAQRAGGNRVVLQDSAVIR